MCPSSREITVFLRQLVLVILYGLLSGVQVGMKLKKKKKKKTSGVVDHQQFIYI